MTIPTPQPEVLHQAKLIFKKKRKQIFASTDRMFAVLMAFQWLACILAALWFSPLSWVGATSSISNNFWAAVIIGGSLNLLPILLVILRPGETSTRYLIAISQMLTSGLLIHLTGGRVETHFHIFGSLAFLSFYRDRRLLFPATAVVALDHIIRGMLYPQSIYGIASPDQWRWLEHAGWVLFEDVFLFVAITQSVKELWSIAVSDASIAESNIHLEHRVAVRTRELASSNLELESEITNRRRLHNEAEIVGKIANSMNTGGDLDELFELMDRHIGLLIKADNVHIAFSDSKTEFLRTAYFRDDCGRTADSDDLRNGLPGLIFRTKEPLLLDNDDILRAIECGDATVAGTIPANWVGVPIRSSKKVIGILIVQNYSDPTPFSSADVRFLSAVSDQLARAIERRESEKVRRQNESLFRDLFENAPVAYHELDSYGRYVRINRTEEKLLGYTSEELKGRYVSELVVEKDSRTATEEKLAGKINLRATERTFIRKDGSHVCVLNEDHLIRDEAGKIIGIRSTLQDITERKLMDDKIRRGQKLESIGQLAAGVAHEINTPTQYVGDNVLFLKDGFDDLQSVIDQACSLIGPCREKGLIPEYIDDLEKTIEDADLEYLQTEVPKAFSQALSGIKRISKIVQSMKEFAHPGVSEKCAADINRAIESTLTVASNEWKYVADVITEYDENLPTVLCLVGEINQVILNLIVNSAHAIAASRNEKNTEKGTIRITTKKNGEWAEIRLSDNGSGIPQNIVERIFDPFFTTKAVGKGTGQGLAISHTVIVDKHGGTIDVDSEEGVGTTFTIRIPISDECPSEVAERPHMELATV